MPSHHPVQPDPVQPDPAQPHPDQPDPDRLDPGPPARRGLPLLISNALDAAGRQAADLATDVLAVVVLGASAAQMGVLNALGTLAFLVLGIPVGVIVDRSPTVRLLLGSGVVRTLLLTSVVLAWSLDVLTMMHLYAVALLAGTAALVAETTQTAIVPRVVGTAGVSRLVSRLQSAESVITLVVPVLAGGLVALSGAGVTLAVGATLTLLAALVVLRLPVQSVESTGSAEGEPGARAALARFFHEAHLGWATLRSRPALWRLSLGTMSVNLGLAVYSAIEVVLVLRELDLGAATLGLIMSAGGVGGLLGSLVAVPLADRLGVPRVLRGSLLLLAPTAALTLVALLDRDRATAWLLAGTFLWGVVIVAYNVVNAGLTAELTPTELLGRVGATRRTLTMGIVPVGGVAGGLLADSAGMVTTVAAWIVLNSVGAAIALTAPLDAAKGTPPEG
ncbi:MFS transporter [Ornithinimicrobium cryptoxanthini]|uniref:MFS transporter n=1 Tax=Ornithinimicrobium cryptoxanthini TaxID=2934161 RepID=A0ABY4YFE8_9MICO|nr:MFS transporter [Ornithinimicrobium cryptoxanthini]USQ75261.1 MFS transporter [Ornithinimicrobium cryptoxanthini]